jgi:hypothetical protein
MTASSQMCTHAIYQHYHSRIDTSSADISQLIIGIALTGLKYCLVILWMKISAFLPQM